MFDLLDVSFDLVSVALAIGATFYAFMLRNRFKGGLLWKPWRIIGNAPLVYAIAQTVHIFQEATGMGQSLEFLSAFLEALFVLILLYGLYALNGFWAPRTKKGE